MYDGSNDNISMMIFHKVTSNREEHIMYSNQC